MGGYMKLIICEKPSLAKNVAEALNVRDWKDGYIESDKYIVTWAFGHLLGLKEIKEYEGFENIRWNDITSPFVPDTFEYKVKNDSGVKNQLKIIRELLKNKNIESVVNCGDADREGQLIIDNIIEYCRYKGKVERLWLPEQTQETIREQINQMKDNKEYEKLNLEGKARTYMDWLLGINLTVYLSNKSGEKLRVGRVIIPILKYIYDREIEIRNFVPEKYYGIENEKNIKLISKLKLDKEKAQEKIEELNLHKAKVVSITEKEIKKQAAKLFSFSTLQSFLSEKYQIPFAISSIVIQKLYEDGYLTYPRTNTEYLANNEKEKIAKVIDKIKNDYGYLDIRIRDSKRIFNDLKIESHSAVTPTVKLPNIFELEDIEQKIYKTVLDRFLSNFIKEECILLEKEMLIKVGNEKFSISGKTVKQLGYLKYESEEFTDKVPDLNVDDEFDIDFKVVEKITTKPPRISESNLSQYLKNPLKKLNNIGTDDEEYKQILEGIEIGTEATRTDIIETAKKMGYISQEKNSYKLEPLGEKVIEILNKLQINLYAEKSIEFSKLLKQVYTREKTIDEVINITREELKNIFSKDIEIEKITKDKEVIGICPLCSGNIYQGRTKTGKVNYYCEKYKEGCKFTLWENVKYYKEEIKITKEKAKALLKKNGKAKFKINNKEETLKIEIKNYQGNTYINLKKF
ncbi:DNA topoisomerase [Fusobacterium animalis]